MYFILKGSPSLCYIYDGDGICEDFEHVSSIMDCGFHTPEGYVDHWALEAVENPDYKHSQCPTDALVGQADKYQVKSYMTQSATRNLQQKTISYFAVLSKITKMG